MAPDRLTGGREPRVLMGGSVVVLPVAVHGVAVPAIGAPDVGQRVVAIFPRED